MWPFVDRYIQRAGNVGCCNWRYPSMVKQAELMWAEKWSTRSGEREYGHNRVVSTRPRSPLTPRAHVGSNPDPPSFVMGSPYSPYTPTHPHHLAFWWISFANHLWKFLQMPYFKLFIYFFKLKELLLSQIILCPIILFWRQRLHFILFLLNNLQKLHLLCHSVFVSSFILVGV